MHNCWMYLPSQWGGQMTVNSFVWCQTWTIKQCSEHFYFYWTGWEVSERLYADFCVIRDENYKALYYTDSVDHLQLDMQIDMKWSKQSKAELLHLLRLSEFSASMYFYNYFGSQHSHFKYLLKQTPPSRFPSCFCMYPTV